VRGAQHHGYRHIAMILDRIAAGEIRTEHLATHVMSLDEGPRGYEVYKNEEDGCVRAVFQPGTEPGGGSAAENARLCPDARPTLIRCPR
jgi:hypothetical protein